MAFSKTTMQEELLAFMTGFADSVSRMYGQEASALLSNPGLIKRSPLWTVADRMYDYGIAGIQVAQLGDGYGLDASEADVELFIYGLNTPEMELYLDEDQAGLPQTLVRTVRTAVARHVLDGGERYTDFGAFRADSGFVDCLSFSELALLADMDERSVRNAANPKLPDPLKTESVGKRTLIPREEARRWLAGRKGFVPTRRPDMETARTHTVGLSVPASVAESLRIKASRAGLSIADYIEQRLANEESEQ